MERDCHNFIYPTGLWDFNSHAHVERDVQTLAEQVTTDISTHTLTWSVTISPTSELNGMTISTHTLTWSVTSYKMFKF